MCKVTTPFTNAVASPLPGTVCMGCFGTNGKCNRQPMVGTSMSRGKCYECKESSDAYLAWLIVRSEYRVLTWVFNGLRHKIGYIEALDE